jgi:hypothetical protein
MEVTAQMVDRLTTIEMRWGGRSDRGVIPKLYDCASEKLGGKPISLVAARRMIDNIKPGDNVFLVTGWACLPFLPRGETDGPLGIASLARAIRIGLGAFPIIVVGSKDMDPVCKTINAAEMLVLDYDEVQKTSGAVATAITFPVLDKRESRKFAASIIDEYKPVAAISVETAGPNQKGIKHVSFGYDVEANDRLPSLECIFTEATAKKILTIAVVDGGNEIGSGTIEECVKKIIPYAEVCQCPCKSGIASVIRTDIVYPVAIANWGAYGITAMIAYLLRNQDILHDAYIEQRMLEADTSAGAFDAHYGRPCMSVDEVDYKTCQGMVTMLNKIIDSALKGKKVDRFDNK